MDDVIPVLVSNVVSAFGMSASEYAGHAAIEYLQARFGISVPPEAVFGEDEQKRSPDELSLFDDSRQ